MIKTYRWFLILLASVSLGWLLGCASVNSSKPQAKSHLSRQSFGKTTDGTLVDLFTLRNRNGTEVKISNYGGIVTSFMVPDRDGKMGDVVLGYDNLDSYIKNSPYFGRSEERRVGKECES